MPGPRSRHHRHEAPVEHAVARPALGPVGVGLDAQVGERAARVGQRLDPPRRVTVLRSTSPSNTGATWSHERHPTTVDEVREGAVGVRERDPDRVPAVDQPPARAVAPGSVWAAAMLSDRRASSGAQLTVSPPSTAKRSPARRASPCSPGSASRKAARSQPSTTWCSASSDRARPGSRRGRRRGLGGCPRRASGSIAQRWKSSTSRSCWSTVRIRSAASPVGARPGLADGVAQRDDLGGRAQRVADHRRAAQHEAAVEEVGDHPLGGEGRLADRDVAHQPRVGEPRPRSGDAREEVAVEREPQPVAEDRLVHGGVAVGERQRRARRRRPGRPRGPRRTGRPPPSRRRGWSRRPAPRAPACRAPRRARPRRASRRRATPRRGRRRRPRPRARPGRPRPARPRPRRA